MNKCPFHSAGLYDEKPNPLGNANYFNNQDTAQLFFEQYSQQVIEIFLVAFSKGFNDTQSYEAYLEGSKNWLMGDIFNESTSAIQTLLSWFRDEYNEGKIIRNTTYTLGDSPSDARKAIIQAQTRTILSDTDIQSLRIGLGTFAHTFIQTFFAVDDMVYTGVFPKEKMSDVFDSSFETLVVPNMQLSIADHNILLSTILPKYDSYTYTQAIDIQTIEYRSGALFFTEATAQAVSRDKNNVRSKIYINKRTMCHAISSRKSMENIWKKAGRRCFQILYEHSI